VIEELLPEEMLVDLC